MAKPLNPGAQEIYDRQIERFEAVGQTPEVTLLRAYATAVAEMEEAQEQIDRLGSVVRQGSGVRASPYVAIRDAAREAVIELSVRLGIVERAPPIVEKSEQEDFSVMQVISAVRAAKGNYGRAALILGCSRRTIFNYASRHAEIAQEVADLKELKKDFAEAKLFDAVEKGEGWAVRHLLYWQAGDRGWSRPAKAAGPDASQVQPGELDLSNLSDADLALLTRLYERLESGGTVAADEPAGAEGGGEEASPGRGSGPVH